MKIASLRTNFTVMLLLLQLAVILAIFLDIPVIRQTLGFIFLSFVPGYVFLRIIKPNDLDFSERIVLSLGLSIAFLMFVGLTVNELGPLLGISRPLSTLPLMVIVNILVLFMAFIDRVTNGGKLGRVSAEILKLSPLAILFIFLPVLSVGGAVLVNVFQNNVMLLLMILATAVLISLGAISKRLLHPRFYSLALLMVSLALLFHASLISNYIYGNDIHAEFNLFNLTNRNAQWNSASPYTDLEMTKLNAMLSVTVLPTFYSTVLNMNETWVFKIIYPLIFSFIAVALYKFYNTKVRDKVAFLATFFLIANFTFFVELPGLARQMVAEIFYVLLFFVLFSLKIKTSTRTILFIVFSAALVVSHYSVSYLFMFLIFFTWLFLYITKRRPGNLNLGLVAFFCTFTFVWYIYVSRSEAFNAVATIWNNISSNFVTDFLNPTSRGQEVLTGLGASGSPSLLHSIGRMFAYAAEFLIVVGFLSFAVKRMKKIFEQEYPLLLSLNMAMILISILVPNFSPSLQMTRLYHLLLIVLAPLFILGIEAVSNFLFTYIPRYSGVHMKGVKIGLFSKLGKVKIESFTLGLILLLLVPFFLFQTEFVYEVTGDYSTSIPLSSYRIGLVAYFDLGFYSEKDIFGAKWLNANLNTNHTVIYGDRSSKFQVLTSYGAVYDPYARIQLLSNATTSLPNSTVYLTQTNTVYGIVRGKTSVFFTENITFLLDGMDKIYSNGGSDIYINSTAP